MEQDSIKKNVPTNIRNIKDEFEQRRIFIRNINSDKKDVLTTLTKLVEINGEDPYFELKLYDKLSEQIDHLNSEEIQFILKQIPQAKEEYSYRVMETLYSKWAETHPLDALDFMDSKNTNQFEGCIIDSWSKSEPDIAFNWIKENIAKAHDSSIYFFYKNLASTDLDEALEKVSEVPNSRTYTALQGVISNTKNASDFENLAEMVEKSKKDNQIFYLYFHWSEIDPVSTLTRIKQSEIKQVKDMKDQVEINFAQSFPLSYLEWQNKERAKGKNENE